MMPESAVPAYGSLCEKILYMPHQLPTSSKDIWPTCGICCIFQMRIMEFFSTLDLARFLEHGKGMEML
jgi:hypothetical protein